MLPIGFPSLHKWITMFLKWPRKAGRGWSLVDALRCETARGTENREDKKQEAHFQLEAICLLTAPMAESH